MRDGREVANYVLDYADENGISVTKLNDPRLGQYRLWDE